MTLFEPNNYEILVSFSKLIICNRAQTNYKITNPLFLSIRFCVQIRRLHYPPDTAIRRSSTPLQQASIFGQPGHVITFMPPVRVDNLLPVELTYYIKGTDINGTIKPGRIASLVTVSSQSKHVRYFYEAPSVFEIALVRLSETSDYLLGQVDNRLAVIRRTSGNLQQCFIFHYHFIIMQS